MWSKIKDFHKKYCHAWVLLYFFVYLAWFFWLEGYVTPDSDYIRMYVPLDDMIPFCEWFMIPYLLWFPYMGLVVTFSVFDGRSNFFKGAAYLFIGMSLCLLICTIWPNGQDLRIEEFSRDNIMTRMIATLYSTDTNTNVFPSIHTYNSVVAFVMVCHSNKLKGNIPVKVISFILSLSIILSTVFLKQHSVLDVIGGIGLAAILYVIINKINWGYLFNRGIKKSQEEMA